MPIDDRGDYTPLPLFGKESLDEYVFNEFMRIAQVLAQLNNARVWHEVGGVGEPAFQNGWSNDGSPYETLAFRLLSNNQLIMKGVITGGTTTDGTVLFTLPEGYRPASEMAKATVAEKTTGAWDASVFLHFKTNGDIELLGASASSSEIMCNVTFFLDN